MCSFLTVVFLFYIFIFIILVIFIFFIFHLDTLFIRSWEISNKLSSWRSHFIFHHFFLEVLVFRKEMSPSCCWALPHYLMIFWRMQLTFWLYLWCPAISKQKNMNASLNSWPPYTGTFTNRFWDLSSNFIWNLVCLHINS